MIYRVSAMLIIDAPDAAQATDRLRDALCEIDGEVDEIAAVELADDPPMPALAEMAVYDDEEAA